jgi:predicted nucleic acid-binding protein
LKSAQAQLRKVRAWLDRNEAIAPTADDYITAATIRATARKQGSLLELPDSLIAAVAVRLGRPVVTGNTDDFLAIQKTGVDLRIENWRQLSPQAGVS